MSRRPDSPQWLAAKAVGDAAELAVAEWFAARGYLVAKTVGRAAYDLLVQCYVEVKHDRQAEQTGRVALEIHNHGQPSGLLTTQATWWAIVVGREMLLLKTTTLRRLVQSNEYPSCFGGDSKSAELILVPLAKIRSLDETIIVPLPQLP